jgi:hypothetical protein
MRSWEQILHFPATYLAAHRQAEGNILHPHHHDERIRKVV